MASLLSDYFGMPEDDEQVDYTSSLLGRPKRKSSGPDMGMLGLAAGLLEPTVNGRLGPAFANGLKGWAGGIAAQRKLDEADAENDPNALMQKYMAQARIKAQVAKEFPDAAEYFAPIPVRLPDGKYGFMQADKAGNVKLLENAPEPLRDSKFVDTGSNIQAFPGGNPLAQPTTIPKGLTPSEAIQNRPNRYTQTQNADGSFTQTDTNTGKQDVVPNASAPKIPPAEFLNTMAQLEDFGPKVDAYIESLKNRGRVTSVIPGREQADLARQHGAMTMALKDIFGLGVLNKGDLPQIEKQVIDPTDPRGALYSNDVLIEQALKTKEAMRALGEAKKREFRSGGYRVDTPVTGPVKFGDQSGSINYSDVSEAEKDLAAHPEWPQETRDQVQSAIDKAKGSIPYSVNKSSVPALKKPTADSLSAARAKINEYANDPSAQANVREQIIRRLQENGYDTTGL